MLPGSTVYADEAAVWDELRARFDTHRINSKDEDACTNQAESFFSRLRRAEMGTHHCICRKYLGSHARDFRANIRGIGSLRLLITQYRR
jgi:hypothetical protein